MYPLLSSAASSVYAQNRFSWIYQITIIAFYVTNQQKYNFYLVTEYTVFDIISTGLLASWDSGTNSIKFFVYCNVSPSILACVFWSTLIEFSKMHKRSLFIYSDLFVVSEKRRDKLYENASYKDYYKVFLACYNNNEMENPNLLHELECRYDNWKL